MRTILTLLLTAFTLGHLPPVTAQSTNWNVSSGDWLAAPNWTGGVPAPSYFVNINNGGTATLGGNAGTIAAMFLAHGGSGGLVLNTGASLTVSSNALIGSLGGAGSLQIHGGVFNVNGLVLTLGATFATASGTVTVSGGQCNFANEVAIGNEGTGLFVVSGTGQVAVNQASIGLMAGSNGTLRLNGGTFTTNQVVGGGGSATVAFGGGTLRLNGNQGTLFNGIGAVTLNAGGGTIDTQGFTVATAAAFTGVGGLIKTGPGTLSLTAANTHTGGAVVLEGTLALNRDAAATGSPALAPNNFAMVSGNGTLRFDSSNALGDSNSTTGASVGVFSSSVTNSGGWYNLFQNLELNASTLSAVGGFPGFGSYGVRNTLTSSGNSQIVIGTANNGALALGPAGATTFAVTSGTLTVNATVTDHLGVAGMLVKTGAGTMMLTGTNTFTGGTAINGGTLAITSNAALGAASNGITFTSGVLRTEAAMTLNRPMTITSGNVAFLHTNGNDVTLSGVVSGNGGLIKQGTGTLTLTNTANSQASTRIDGGVLSISDDRHLGAAGGTLFMNGGILRNTAFNLPVNRPMVVQANSTIETVLSLFWTGAITDAGGPAMLIKSGNSGGLFLCNANNIWSGGITVTAGRLYVGASGGSPGSLGTGPVILGNNVNDLVFQQTNSLTISQVISGNSGVILIGPATTTLTASNTFTSGVFCNNGMLVVASPTTPGASGTGSGLVRISGGALGGTGRVGGLVELQSGSTLRGDSGTGTGTLTLDNGVWFNQFTSGNTTLAVQLATNSGTITASSLVNLTAGKCNIDLANANLFRVQVLNDAGLADGQTYTLPLITGPAGGQSFQRSGVDLANGFSFNAADFQVVGSGAWHFANANLTVQNNALMLSFTIVPVPEPAWLCLVALGIVTWVRRAGQSCAFK